MSTQSIPNFAEVSLHAGDEVVDVDRWRIDVAQETGQPVEELTWETPEGIDVRPMYGAADRAGLGFVDSLPGIPPFVRGPYPTMYVNQPWTIRQYAGFSTAEASNAFYRRNLLAGQKGPRSSGSRLGCLPLFSWLGRYKPHQYATAPWVLTYKAYSEWLLAMYKRLRCGPPKAKLAHRSGR